MDLHVIGGFLGSGKTTAIIHAIKVLQNDALRVGVITNDKGHHLVDTAFIQSADILVAEVPGGCFRCNEEDFRRLIQELTAGNALDVIFAESVGSCVDLVGPVLTHLNAKGHNDVSRVTYTVFSDIRLFERFLDGSPLPFSDNISYIFQKQIEEAPVLVINKTDLKPEKANNILEQAIRRYPDKKILLQNSLSPAGIAAWLQVLKEAHPLKDTFRIDYTPYIAGAAELAWYDDQLILLPSNGKSRTTLVKLLKEIHDKIQQTGKPVAHLKVFIRDAVTSAKVSLTTIDMTDIDQDLPEFNNGSIEILINARIQIDAEQLKNLMQETIAAVLAENQVTYQQGNASAFAPKVPENTSLS